MSRRLVLTALGIIGLVIGIGAAAVSRKEYVSFIEGSLRNEAATHGIRLATRNFDVFPFGVRASEVDAYLVRSLLSLTVGNAIAQLRDLTPSATFSGDMYEGTLAGTIARPWFSNEVTAQASVTTVNLAKHPQLGALGVSSGALDLTIFEATFDTATQRLRKAHFEGKVTQFARTTPLTIRPGQFGSPFGVTIPPIPPTDIEIDGSIDEHRLALSRAIVTTALGEISASADIPLDPSRDVVLDALVSLSSEGSAKVGPYLPLLSEGAIDPQATKIRLVVGGTLKAPRLKWSRAG